MPRRWLSPWILCALVLLSSACSLSSPQSATTPTVAAPARETTVSAPLSTAPPVAAASTTVSEEPSAPTTTTGSTVIEATPDAEPPQAVSATPAPSATATSAPSPTATPTPVPLKTMYVSTEGYVDVNLRAKPTTDSDIVLVMPYRARVRAEASPVQNSKGEDWYKVTYGSNTGYVFGALLSEQRPRPVPPGMRGVVVDSGTGEPVVGAWVYLGGNIARTDDAGRYKFRLPAGDNELTVLAPGYARFDAEAAKVARGWVGLDRFDARGVYMPFFQTAQPAAVERMFDMIDSTALNAIVIDVKSDEGLVWRSNVPMARQIGASVDYMDLRAFTEAAHKRRIYVIARFTVFKDPKLANARPDLAITSTEGGLWEDAPGVAYADPFSMDAWRYLGDLAVEIAAQGVDEIQYDYVRFPVDGDLSTARFDAPSTAESRPQQITAFVRYMESRLRPSKVFISADIFGRVVFHPVDVDTGQILEDFMQYVDYVSPMLYPSGFNRGSAGFDIPTQNSYGLIKESLALTNERVKGTNTQVRPWLQSFADYAFDQPYGLTQYLEQRRAADELNTSGWLYWNPSGSYDPRTFAGSP